MLVHRQSRRVGQESDDAAQAAGNAAFERAKQSSWPPTEGDYQAIGTVAGTAAGAALGGPIGAAVGSVVGSAVGSAVFSLVGAIAGGLDPGGGGPGPLMLSNYRRTVAPAPKLAAEKLATDCGTSFAAEVQGLQRRGMPIDDTAYPTQVVMRSWANTLNPGGGGPTQLQAQVEAFQRLLFAATAARVAECETIKAQKGAKSSGSMGAVVVLGIVSAVGVGLLQKFITRGKF